MGGGLFLFVLALLSNAASESRAMEVKTAQTTAASAACSTSRRNFGVSSVVAAAATLLSPFCVPAPSCWADGDDFNFEARDRKGNKEAVIRDDYWYIVSRTPPRQLKAPLVGSEMMGGCSQKGYARLGTLES